MARPAVCVEGLSKRYEIGLREPYHRFSEVLSGWGRRALAAPRDWFRRSRRPACSGGSEQPATPFAELWALKDVSFEIKEGEVLGIIGANGAGKSTLLKILARITEPTTGRFGTRGRVASLLEVGTGFHPELTGRENIYLNGAVLGMERREIARAFDKIVDFAEVERFLETPVKHYSSGMYMRLAFSVAAHLEPEILLVDEVLAVGDAAFQRKCLGRMDSLAASGRTVILISHNMSAVQALATRVIWLETGMVRASGAPREVVPRYLSNQSAAENERRWDDLNSAPGSQEARLHRVSVRRTDDQPDGPITVHTPLALEFEFWNFAAGMRLNLSVCLMNLEGLTVFNSFPIDERGWYDKPYPAGLVRSTCLIPGDLLNDGTYFVQLFIVADQSRVLSRHDGLLSFTVLDGARRGTSWHGKWIGVVRPALDWQTELISPGLDADGVSQGEGALR